MLSALAVLLKSLVFAAAISNLSLAPNPFSPNGDGRRDTLHIKFTTTDSGSLVVKILDISGRDLRTISQNQTVAANQNLDITWDGKDGDGRDLPNGVYLILVDLNGTRLAAKAVIRR